MDFDKLNRKLEGLGKASHNGFRVRNLHEIMGCLELWYVAYSNIYSNQGAMTKGIDEITLDGLSKERIEKLIESIKARKYRPKPVKRVYIPKKDGTKRPLGVPSGDDKLVQSVIKILLESIYESVFTENSHGFRPNKSCHTALEQIHHTWTGVKWFIEFDIKGFFDNVDHDILINLLEKKIDDKRFIKLIKSFLKAGYMEDFVYNKTYSRTPQGGIISPILSNIYLHELDLFMDSQIAKFDIGKRRPKNLEYYRITSKIARLRIKIREEGNIPELLDKQKTLQKQRQSMPSGIENTGEYKRLRYCRYADDFVCGIIGSFNDAKEAMQSISKLLQNLKLQLSKEKTDIKRATKPIEFLGYNIESRLTIREKKVKIKGTTSTLRRCGRVLLSIPKHKVISFCNKNGYGNWQSKKATHRGKLVTSSEAEIITTYNAELRGLANYYQLAKNIKHELNALLTLAHHSLFKTLSNKRKRKVSQTVRDMKSNDYHLKVKTKQGWKSIKLFQLKDLTRNTTTSTIDNLPTTAHLYKSGTELIKRMQANQCEYCGIVTSEVEVHHVHKLKDLQSKNHLEHWEKVMIARNRKTMILCKQCHNLLHQGKLPDKRYIPKKT